MKKIVCALLFLLALVFAPIVKAEEFDLAYFLQLAQSKNIDINEEMKRAYIGHSFEHIQKSTKPYVVVFADFTDIATATKYANNGYFVYNNLQHDYGFSAFNIKNSDNKALVEKLKIKTVPYVIVTNPKTNKILPIKPALYENPKKLVYLLRAYKRKMN